MKLILAYVLLALVIVYPMIIHVVTCVEEKLWGWLAFGIVLPPVGWLHGVYNIISG